MDNTDRLLKALDHGTCLSDEDLDRLTKDSTLREDYKLLCRLRDAMAEPQPADIDREWELFLRKHPKVYARRSNAAMRKAAAIIIGIAVAVGAVAAVVKISYSNNTGVVVESDEASSIITDTAIVNNQGEIVKSNESADDIIFKGERLDEIINVIGQYYGVSVQFEKPDAAGLRLYFRWNRNDGIADVVAALSSFEQINIELEDDKLIVE